MSTRFVYLDTCALMRFSEGAVQPSTERNQIGRAKFQALLDDPDVVLAMTEIGVIEFHDALGRVARGGAPQHDDAWQQVSIEVVMRLIAMGRITMIPVPPKAIESALVLMQIAHAGPRVAFHSWDAVHLIAACAWAVQLHAKVEFATCDTDFTRFFGQFPYFASLVSVLMVAEPGT